jgi:hypothetical protein
MPLRGFARPAPRALRRIASASMAVSPGTPAVSPSPISVAPQDGQVAAAGSGRTAEHQVQRA